jgi:hypothetical protein
VFGGRDNDDRSAPAVGHAQRRPLSWNFANVAVHLELTRECALKEGRPC